MSCQDAAAVHSGGVGLPPPHPQGGAARLHPTAGDGGVGGTGHWGPEGDGVTTSVGDWLWVRSHQFGIAQCPPAGWYLTDSPDNFAGWCV